MTQPTALEWTPNTTPPKLMDHGLRPWAQIVNGLRIQDLAGKHNMVPHNAIICPSYHMHKHGQTTWHTHAQANEETSKCNGTAHSHTLSFFEASKHAGKQARKQTHQGVRKDPSICRQDIIPLCARAEIIWHLQVQPMCKGPWV